ncbi:hypothetical protein MPTK1_1g03020 [Marchantia polymorpha subsp. ruderalis]|uniref:Uncharacterized protein n=2 Tax=Marchantia polymorpha TaxID=3197 RepID=A0AAF6AKY1_MARPO|nr:hypothetical protein MARPO_0113s0050 [Marchantia polymorpha]BBM97101.1 hypothetical protein Mp_1g03020 [Marchantia polymorpha subsp. ruderalis]|eukprot:PTQ31324.1 hypothetical protein MARPO_0113s0050 [Marchantia polymorpha]
MVCGIQLMHKWKGNKSSHQLLCDLEEDLKALSRRRRRRSATAAAAAAAAATTTTTSTTLRNECTQRKKTRHQHQQKQAEMMSGRLQQPVFIQQQQNQHQHQHQHQQQANQQQRAAGEVAGCYGCPGLVDQRDIVWPKLQVLKAKYLHDMEQLYKLITSFDSRSLNAEHVLKLHHYKEVVHRALTYLRVTRERLPLEFNQEILEVFGKQIVMIIETFKRKPDTAATSTMSKSSASHADGKI